MKNYLFALLLLGPFCGYCQKYVTEIEDISPEVTHIMITNKALTEFPEEIKNLPNLEYLNLSNNLIETLPDEKLFLPSLKELVLDGNPGINTFDFPQINENFSHLKSLSLSGCSINALSQSIIEFKSLEYLNLSNNLITSLPMELADLKKLKVLDASFNLIENPIGMSELWALEELDLQGNTRINFSCLGVALIFKSNLKKIHLYSAQSKLLPKSFEFTTIREFKFTEGEVSNPSLHPDKYSGIEKITFDNVVFSQPDKLYTSLSALENLDTLVFENTKMEGNLQLLSKVPFIQIINCDINSFSDFTKLQEKTVVEAEKINASEASESIISYFSEAMENNQVIPLTVEKPKSIKFQSTETTRLEEKIGNFTIPPGAFLTESGEVYSGEVNIELTEYTDPFTIALSGIPMTYNEGGQTELFGSAGMFRFDAFTDNGEKLKPNPQQPIQVEVKNLQPDEENNLYVFNDSTNNWTQTQQLQNPNTRNNLKAFIDSLNAIPDSTLAGKSFINKVKKSVLLHFKKSRKDPYKIWLTGLPYPKSVRDFASRNFINISPTSDSYWIANNGPWILDTLIDDSKIEILKSIKKEQKTIAKTSKDSKKNPSQFVYSPAIISDVRLEKDFKHDNFRLIFEYKGKQINWPVYNSYESSNVGRIRKKEKKLYKEYDKLKDEADELTRQGKILMKKFIKKRAQQIRNQRILAFQRINSPNRFVSDEMLRFDLTEFGLINCDYFYNNPPEDYIVIEDNGQNTNGKKVELPKDLRMIILDGNAYLSLVPGKIPFISRTGAIYFYSIDKNSIAVVKEYAKLKKGNKFTPIVEKINIKDLTPQEVKNILLNS